jgi:hypothetical protein
LERLRRLASRVFRDVDAVLAPISYRARGNRKAGRPYGPPKTSASTAYRPSQSHAVFLAPACPSVCRCWGVIR